MEKLSEETKDSADIFVLPNAESKAKGSRLEKLEDFLFAAHSCMACGAECEDEGYRICFRCKKALDFISHRHCVICGTKIGEGYDICVDCKKEPRAFEKSRSVMIYDALSAQILLKFKFGGLKDYAKPLGKMLFDLFCRSDLFAHAATFVPMPKKREKERGYNQSYLLALEFCKLSNIPLICALERAREADRQTTLGREDRKKNLQGGFKVSDKKLVKDKEILLIDDVMTTGATASECAKTLIDAGAKSVSVLTVAKTPALFVLE